MHLYDNFIRHRGKKKLIAYASKLQTMNVKKKLIFEQNSSKSFNFVANFWWFYYIIHRNFQWDEEKKMLGVWCSQKLCSLITFRLFLYALTEIYAHNKIPWPKLYAYELVCIFRLAKKTIYVVSSTNRSWTSFLPLHRSRINRNCIAMWTRTIIILKSNLRCTLKCFYAMLQIKNFA